MSSSRLAESARAISCQVSARACTAEQIARRALAGLDLGGPGTGWLRAAPERALAAAFEVDRQLAAGGEPGPLAGVPFSVKDNLHLAGVATTCASKILEHFVPEEDAGAVRGLLRAGAVPLGKTDLDEFGMGATGEASALGSCTHPTDPERVAGGSSSGAARSVALGQVPLALGSDTGGSVRLPAAYCGVLGLRPTYGTVSRSGLVAFASSMDQVGLLGQHAADLELALQALREPDPGDASLVPCELRRRSGADCGDLAGVRLGVVRQWAGPDLPLGTRESFLAGLEDLRQLGASVQDLDLPILSYAAAVYHLIASAEASANLARFDGIRFGASMPPGESYPEGLRAGRGRYLGSEVKLRILLGTFVLSRGNRGEWLLQAQRVRRRIQQALAESLERTEVLVGLTASDVAPPRGELTGDPVARQALDGFTAPASLAGFPALSVPLRPCSRTGLPLGLQLVGKPGHELLLLEIAGLLQASSKSPIPGVYS